MNSSLLLIHLRTQISLPISRIFSILTHLFSQALALLTIGFLIALRWCLCTMEISGCSLLILFVELWDFSFFWLNFSIYAPFNAPLLWWLTLFWLPSFSLWIFWLWIFNFFFGISTLGLVLLLLLWLFSVVFGVFLEWWVICSSVLFLRVNFLPIETD